MFRRKSSSGTSTNGPSPTSPFSFLSRRNSTDNRSNQSDATSTSWDGKSTCSSVKEKSLNLATATSNEVLLRPYNKSRASISLAIVEHSIKLRDVVQKKINKINKLDKENKKAPIHYASLFGTPDELQLILGLGHASIDVNLADGLKRTALHYAIISKRIEIQDILLRQNDIDVKIMDMFGYTPFHYAIANDDPDSLRSLLNKEADFDPANVSTPGSETLLLFSLRLAKENSAIEIIKQSSKDVNAIDGTSGRTPLHYACELQFETVIHALIEHGADPTLTDHDGKIPTDYLSNNQVILDFMSRASLSKKLTRNSMVNLSTGGANVIPISNQLCVTDRPIEESLSMKEGNAVLNIQIGSNSHAINKREIDYEGLFDDISDDSKSQCLTDSLETGKLLVDKNLEPENVIVKNTQTPSDNVLVPKNEADVDSHNSMKSPSTPVIDISPSNSKSSDILSILSDLDDISNPEHTIDGVKSQETSDSPKLANPIAVDQKVDHVEGDLSIRQSSSGSLWSNAITSASKVITGVFTSGNKANTDSTEPSIDKFVIERIESDHATTFDTDTDGYSIDSFEMDLDEMFPETKKLEDEPKFDDINPPADQSQLTKSDAVLKLSYLPGIMSLKHPETVPLPPSPSVSTDKLLSTDIRTPRRVSFSFPIASELALESADVEDQHPPLVLASESLKYEIGDQNSPTNGEVQINIHSRSSTASSELSIEMGSSSMIDESFCEDSSSYSFIPPPPQEPHPDRVPFDTLMNNKSNVISSSVGPLENTKDHQIDVEVKGTIDSRPNLSIITTPLIPCGLNNLKKDSGFAKNDDFYERGTISTEDNRNSALSVNSMSPMNINQDYNDLAPRKTLECRNIQEESDRINLALEDNDSLAVEYEIKEQQPIFCIDADIRKSMDKSKAKVLIKHDDAPVKKQILDLQPSHVLAPREQLGTHHEDIDVVKEQHSIVSSFGKNMQSTGALNVEQEDEGDATSMTVSPGPSSFMDGSESIVTRALGLLDQSHKIDNQTNDMTRLRQQIDEAEHQYKLNENALKQELQIAQQANELSQQKIATMEIKLKAIEAQVQIDQQRIVDYEKELASATTAQANLKRKLSAANAAGTENEDEIKQLKSEMTVKMAKIDALTQQNAELQTIKQIRDENELEIDRLKSQLAHQVAQLKAELQAQASSNEVSAQTQDLKFKTEVGSLTNQLQIATNESHRLIQANLLLSNEKSELESKVTQLTNSLSRTTKELEFLKQEISAGEENKSNLGMVMGKLRAEKAAVNAALDEKSDQFAKLHRQYTQSLTNEKLAIDEAESLRSATAQLRMELGRLNAQILEKESNLVAFTAQVEDLNSQLQALERQANTASEESLSRSNKLDKQVKDLEEEREKLKCLIAELQQSMNELTESNHSLNQNAQNRALAEDEITRIKNEYESKLKHFKSLSELGIKPRPSDLSLGSDSPRQIINDSIEGQLTSRSKDLETIEELRNQISDLQSTINDLEVRKNAISDDRNRFKSKLDTKQHDMEQKNALISGLEDQITELQGKLSVTENNLRRIQSQHDALQLQLDLLNQENRMNQRFNSVGLPPRSSQTTHTNRANNDTANNSGGNNIKTDTKLPELIDQYQKAQLTIIRNEGEIEAAQLCNKIKTDLMEQANMREQELVKTIDTLRRQLKETEDLLISEKAVALDRVKQVLKDLEQNSIHSITASVQALIERSTRSLLDQFHAKISSSLMDNAGNCSTSPNPVAHTPKQPSSPIHVHWHGGRDYTEYVPINKPVKLYKPSSKSYTSPPVSQQQQLVDQYNSQKGQQNIINKIAYLEQKLHSLSTPSSLLINNQSPNRLLKTVHSPNRLDLAHTHASPSRIVLTSSSTPFLRSTVTHSSAPSIKQTIAKLKLQNAALERKLDAMHVSQT